MHSTNNGTNGNTPPHAPPMSPFGIGGAYASPHTDTVGSPLPNAPPPGAVPFSPNPFPPKAPEAFFPKELFQQFFGPLVEFVQARIASDMRAEKRSNKWERLRRESDEAVAKLQLESDERVAIARLASEERAATQQTYVVSSLVEIVRSMTERGSPNARAARGRPANRRAASVKTRR